MRRITVVVFMLCAICFGDVEPEYIITPVRIYFNDGKTKDVWVTTGYTYPGSSWNPEYGNKKRPIPGGRVLFLNRLTKANSIKVSEELYMLPDSLTCLIESRLSLKGIRMIEDIHSDSQPTIGIWGERWVSAEVGKVLTTRKPHFVDLIVTEDAAAYNAEHVYCFDGTFTKDQVRKLYKAGGRNNGVLKKAMEELRIIIIQEVTP